MAACSFFDFLAILSFCLFCSIYMRFNWKLGGKHIRKFRLGSIFIQKSVYDHLQYGFFLIIAFLIMRKCLWVELADLKDFGH